MNFVGVDIPDLNIFYSTSDAPTLARFHLDDTLRRVVMGPFGSGKSVAMIAEVVGKAMTMPADRQGVRRSRVAVVRGTYRQLETTTIKTWQEWVPDKVCPLKFGSPITGNLKTTLGDGTSVDLEVMFFPLDNNDAINNLTSLELTGVWLNEVREMDLKVVNDIFGRTGRFPRKAAMPSGFQGVRWLIADTNMCDDDHWLYQLAEKEKPDDWKFFIQPGALIKRPDGSFVPNPDAENVTNHALGYRYWSDMVSTLDPEKIKVHILAQYGSLFTGRAVYGDWYSEQMHISPHPLPVFKGVPLRLGWDYGLTPACVAFQITPHGGLNVLNAWACDYGDLKSFAKEVVKPALVNEFAGLKIISVGDPAGSARGQADGLSCEDILAQLGIPTVSAPTQDFAIRRGAVVDWMKRMVGGRAALQINRSDDTTDGLSMFRRGCAGGYQFDRVQVIGQERYRDKPCKNIYSHLQEAFQYGVMGANHVDSVSLLPDVPAPPPTTWGAYT